MLVSSRSCSADPPSWMRTTIASTPRRFELGNQRVDGVGLVQEVEPGDAGRADDRRGALERHADERHLGAVEVLDRVRREQRLTGRCR